MKNMEMVMDAVLSLRLGEIARSFLLYNREQEVLYTYNIEDKEEQPDKDSFKDILIGELYGDYTEDDVSEMAQNALQELDYLDFLASQFAEEESDERSNPATNVVFSIRYDREIKSLDEVNLPQYMEMTTLGGDFLYLSFSDVKKYMSEENTVVFVADIQSGEYNESLIKSIGRIKRLYITPKPDTYPVPTDILGIMFLMGDEEVMRVPTKVIASCSTL